MVVLSIEQHVTCTHHRYLFLFMTITSASVVSLVVLPVFSESVNLEEVLILLLDWVRAEVLDLLLVLLGSTYEETLDT